MMQTWRVFVFPLLPPDYIWMRQYNENIEQIFKKGGGKGWASGIPGIAK